ncbi:MAG: lytic murein transglycosylase B [Thauera sp.]|jgi:membrane-bound lytic murein transglycosylase B|nr:lytic murein transglycosylase B [Thauera sp.]
MTPIFSFPALLLSLAGILLPVQAEAQTQTPAQTQPQNRNYATGAEVERFIDELVSEHGFEAAAVRNSLALAERNAQVIRLITPPGKRQPRSWQKYRGNFLSQQRIDGGVQFWQQHEALLQLASERFGVPPEIVVAIIGVETFYGRNTGNFQTLSALATLAFDYPPRAELFRRELGALFLLAREQQRAVTDYYGSYAGAIGHPQFLPSSIRAYAVDFDDNGHIDFDSNAVDAIGSVANYLHAHGWQAGAPIAAAARLALGSDPAPLIAAGIEPALSPQTLTAAGISTLSGAPAAATATLVDLETPGQTTAYWLGYRNFYVITRYNRSSFYAMAVFELAEAVRKAYQNAR